MRRVKLCLAVAALALASCGDKPPVISAPPPEWTEPVAVPVPAALPENATPAQVDDAGADYIIRLHDALVTANNRLARLKDWAAGVR